MDKYEGDSVTKRIHITFEAIIKQLLGYVKNASLRIDPYLGLRITPPLPNNVTVLQWFVKGKLASAFI
jgi:hypothetical protein